MVMYYMPVIIFLLLKLDEHFQNFDQKGPLNHEVGDIRHSRPNDSSCNKETETG
jgi:hypothetical protein